MKARIFYKDYMTKKYRKKTIEVEEKEPCAIVREFVRITNCSRNTYITHIKCGRRDYQWYGDVNGAF